MAFGVLRYYINEILNQCQQLCCVFYLTNINSTSTSHLYAYNLVKMNKHKFVQKVAKEEIFLKN